MPFPLAHPAAVLPLRRFCPRFLSFPALLVGTLSPDAGYAISKYGVDELSHRLIGTIAFCLPVSLVTLLLLCGLLSRLAPALPDPYRRAALSLCSKPFRAPLAVVVSIVLGACLHLCWDSFTHRDGWLVGHWDLLRWPLARVGYRTLRICHLLWYASTFLGVAALFMAFQRWFEGVCESSALPSRWVRLRNAGLLATLMLPMGAAHHLVRHVAGDFIVIALSALLVIGFLLWVGPRPRTAPAPNPSAWGPRPPPRLGGEP